MTTNDLSTVVETIRFILTTEKGIELYVSPIIMESSLQKILSARENGKFLLFKFKKGKEELSIEVALTVTFYKHDCEMILSIVENSLFNYENGNPLEVRNEKKYYLTYILEEKK